jgi:hypothetical protein
MGQLWISQEICQCSWIGFLTFCLFKSWSAVTGLPDHGWSFTSKFCHYPLIFSPNSIVLCPQYLHHKRPVLTSQLWRVSLLGVKNSTTIHCLMHFNTTENEPSIMNIIWHTLWQTEAQRASRDKFCFKATLLAQDTFTFPNTTCINSLGSQQAWVMKSFNLKQH